MNGPVAALLGAGSGNQAGIGSGSAARLHLQHGPIDLIIGVDADTQNDRQQAFRAAAARFDTILEELAGELPLLRRAMTDTIQPLGDVARRMAGAVRPHAAQVFVTPMAAVAGAVADEILGTMIARVPVTRAYVNNGGDIALHLTAGTHYSAVIAGLDGVEPGSTEHGRLMIDAASPARGIATSGQGGRSLSLGIADSVTVLAHDAAKADVAATLIANAVDLPGHPSIRRTPACDIAPDSDLEGRLVVTHVGPLNTDEVDKALSNGVAAAQSMLDRGLILGAALFLRRARRIIGPLTPRSITRNETDPSQETKMVKHA